MMNRITLIGRLGRQPELRTLESGSQVVSFSMATSAYYRDKNGKMAEQTEWHDIALWGDNGVKLADILDKGTLVVVEGKLTHRRYTDREGITRSRSEVLADSIQILERKTPQTESLDVVGETAEMPF